MVECGTSAANWREAADYAPLLGADRSIFAWEWLRRDPNYRKAWAGVVGNRRFVGESAQPGIWGLQMFEDPDLGAPCARPMWSARVHDLVLLATAELADDSADAIDLARLGALATLIESEGGEHVLISDGLRAIRLDIFDGTLGRGLARLSYRLAGLASAERPILALRRLIAFCRSGRFSETLHPSETRASRFILMLRAHDALVRGATQREIASVLLSSEAEERRWRVNAPTLRSRAQRLVRNARAMARGGYWDLLVT